MMQVIRQTLSLCLMACLCCVTQAEDQGIFSSLSPGQATPENFRMVSYPNAKPNKFAWVSDLGTTVLKVDSSDSAGSLALPVALLGGQTSNTLQWRWKVDKMLDRADMDKKLADDHSARVYVFFDVPIESLSFADRTKIRLARAFAGPDVPTAALCYVWDNRHRAGYTAWSPFTQQLRKVVLQTGPEAIGQWRLESRDVAADFKEAFGFDAPAVTAISVGNDTDNTNDRVTSWFGDIRFKK